MAFNWKNSLPEARRVPRAAVPANPPPEPGWELALDLLEHPTEGGPFLQLTSGRMPPMLRPAIFSSSLARAIRRRAS